MVVSAAHFKEVTNGYERRSDGLWVHRGKADIGTLRVTTNMWPVAGQGLELVYNPAAALGQIQSYNRDTATWGDLNINAKNITLAPQAGGKVNLPAGTAQAQIGVYVNTPTFSTTAPSSWVATPITCQATSTGGLLRVEYSVLISHTVATATLYHGVALDTVVQGPWSYDQVPAAGGLIRGVGGLYLTPAAGLHTFTVNLFNNTGSGTMSIPAAGHCYLYVTEQRA